MQMSCLLIKLTEEQNKNIWGKKKIKNRKSHLLPYRLIGVSKRIFCKADKPSVQA